LNRDDIVSVMFTEDYTEAMFRLLDSMGYDHRRIGVTPLSVPHVNGKIRERNKLYQKALQDYAFLQRLEDLNPIAMDFYETAYLAYGLHPDKLESFSPYRRVAQSSS